MKSLIFVLVLPGCSHIVYKNGPVELNRWSIGSDLTIRQINDTVNKQGEHNVKIAGYNGNQSEAIKKATAAAIDAVMSSTP